MLVVAIDVGIKNLAYCAMRDAEVVEWANEALTEGTYTPMHNVQYVHAFVQRHARLLAAADLVVVERQMRVNMRIIEAVLHAMHMAKCKVVQARTIKLAYGLCKGNYRLNKNAAVDHVQKLLSPGSRAEAIFAQARKKDDLADAYLMALFFSTRDPRSDVAAAGCCWPGATSSSPSATSTSGGAPAQDQLSCSSNCTALSS